MEKFILAAMVMCAAIAAQAAISVDFSYTDDSQSGYTLYVVSVSDASDIRDLFLNGKGTSALSALSSDKLVSWTDSDMDKEVNETFTVDEATLNWQDDMFLPWRVATVQWGMLMITSDQMYWKVGDFLMNYKDDDGNLSGELESVGTYNSWTPITEENIPEPTSGMLMLLGIAGLALKRRR